MKRIRSLVYMISIGVLLSFCGCQSENDLNIEIIDVGKGDCTILSTDNNTVMIDTGYSGTTDDVKEYLKQHNISVIDDLILTHFDKDHIGGAVFILDNYDVKTVYIPDYQGCTYEYEQLMTELEKGKSEYEYVRSDTDILLDGINITIYPSGVKYKKNENDMSLIIMVGNGDDSFLFTGDIEKKGVKKLLDRLGDNEQFDVIKIPHHGEYESKLKDLIKTVLPKSAIITDSSDSPCDNKLYEYLEKKDVDVYTTAEKGNINISSDSNDVITFNCEK